MLLSARRREIRNWQCVIVIAVAVISFLPSAAGKTASTGQIQFAAVATQPCSIAPSAGVIRQAIDYLNLGLTNGELANDVGMVSNLYSNLCTDSGSSALNPPSGAAGLALGLYGASSEGLVFANVTHYLISRGSAATVMEESWSMDLRTGAIVGPLTSSVQALGASPAYQTATYNWAGWEFNGGSSLPTLSEASGATQVVSSLKAEPGQETLPAGAPTIPSAAAVWVGISPDKGGSCGSGCLDELQTGYAYDASSPSADWCAGFASSCDYGLWWVAANVGSYQCTVDGYVTGECGPFGYSGNPVVKAGDDLTMSDLGPYTISGSALWCTVQILDQTTGKSWSETIQTGTWSPTYGDFIVEAPTAPVEYIGDVVAQIPGFSANTIQLEEGFICPNNDVYCVTVPTLVKDGWYDTYYIQQSSGATNTEGSIVNGCTNFGGESDTCLNTNWLTSIYNFCWLYPSNNYCTGGGGGGGCVANGTPILTPTGYVPVQYLKRGQPVEEYDLASHQMTVGTFRSGNATNVTQLIDINHGQWFVTPTDQPIYIRNATHTGWLRDPQNLTIQDWIFDPVSGQWIPVVSVGLVPGAAVVHDVVTSNFNNFVANGALFDLKPGG